MKQILFLDLDGTVREPASEAKFINDPHDQKLIEGAEQAIAHYKNWLIIGITNQGGVAAGHKSLEDAITEQLITLQLIPQMQSIFFCPDHEGQQCWMVDRVIAISEYVKPLHLSNYCSSFLGQFRKPKAGMILAACFVYGMTINPGYLMIGDRSEDKEAASAARINFMWAHDWRSK